MFSKLPKSLWWFAAALVVYLLQVFPYTGIFLMFLLAPYWVGALITIGMVSLVIEAGLSRTISSNWLAIPVFYVSAYAAAYVLSIYEFNRLERQAATASAVAQVPFDRARDPLLIRSDTRRNSERLAQHLVRYYGVGRVYSVNHHPRKTTIRQYGIAPLQKCDLIASREGAYKLGAGVFTLAGGSGVWNSSSIRSKKPRDTHCGYWIERGPEPGERPLRIDVTSSDERTWLLGRLRRSSAQVTRPDGSNHTYHGGSGATLQPFPYPLAGCFLNSGAPSWDCQVTFLRTRLRGFAGSDRYAPTIAPIIAHALGLSKTTIDEVATYSGAISVAVSNDYFARRLDQTVAKVRAAIADPESFPFGGNLNAFPGIEDKPEVLVPLVPAIVDELILRTRGKPAPRGNTLLLHKFLALQSDTVLKAHLPPYLERLAVADRQGLAQLQSNLVERFSALGTNAIPVLERYLREHRNRYALAKAAEAICRIGPAARPLAPAIRELASGHNSRRAPGYAFFVAALSMGETELANDVLPVARNERMEQRQEEIRATARRGDRDKLCRMI